MHPEFLGARIREAAAGAKAVSATPAEALKHAWPSAGVLMAPLLLAAPAGDSSADGGVAGRLRPQMSAPGGVTLDSLAELLAWDTQVRNSLGSSACLSVP